MVFLFMWISFLCNIRGSSNIKHMEGISRDFISEERRNYRFKIGTTIASALAGFLAGVIVTSMVFVSVIAFLADK